MNSQLYDKQYPIPKPILGKIQAKMVTSNGGGEGFKRAKNLLKTGYCTYQMLKRLKNFFDYLNPATQQAEFELIGGQDMKLFVDRTLQSEREQTKISNNTNNTSMPHSAMDNTLNLQKSANMDVNESEIKDKKSRGSLAVIVNEDNKVLIVKRAPFKGSWMPNKHALVGGKIDKGEEPIDAAKREIYEEAGLQIEQFVDSFNIVSPPSTVDYVFIAKAPKDQEVKLNEEHTEFGWYDLKEIADLDTVPLLEECLELALNKLSEKSIYNK